MTTPGPKPKPTALKAFEGNPSNRPFNEHEPTPQKLTNKAPCDWMEPDCEYMTLDRFPLHQVAKMIWHRFEPELSRLNILTELDRELFGRYCETFARWLKMKAFIDKNGEAFPVYGGQFEPVFNEDGEPVLKEDGKQRHAFKKYLKKMQAFPQVAIYKSLGGELRKYEAEFGIGAAARTRIQTVVESDLANGGQAKDDDEFNYAKRHGLRAVK